MKKGTLLKVIAPNSSLKYFGANVFCKNGDIVKYVETSKCGELLKCLTLDDDFFFLHKNMVAEIKKKEFAK